MINYAAPADDRGAEPQKHTILVVEDDILVRTVAAEYLRDAGFGVVEAANASEALDVLSSHRVIDLVFTDINMPGPMDGVAMARWVDENVGVPVLFTSGAPKTSAAERQALGARFVPKPYIFADVERRIRALLPD